MLQSRITLSNRKRLKAEIKSLKAEIQCLRAERKCPAIEFKWQRAEFKRPMPEFQIIKQGRKKEKEANQTNNENK